MKLRIWAKENRKRIIGAVSFGLLPLIFCSIYCALYHKGLWDIYLPTSYWNDELFYFKQVDGILAHGVPGGYFGFNESHGRFLSFAAWSPVLLYVWVFWGLLFGWGILSPIICNLVVISLCMFAFAWMAKPGRRQMIAMAILLGVFSPFTRYIMSMSLEVLCCSLLFVYMGALFGYERDRKNGYLWIMMIASAILTLTRPYFVLLVLYPAFFYGKQGVKKQIPAIGIPVGAFGGYALLKYLFSAEYLHSLFEISFLTKFWEEGIGVGFLNLWTVGKNGVLLIFDFLKKAVKYGHSSGCFYAIYGLLGVLLFVMVFMEWRQRKNKSTCYRVMCMIATMAIMLLAILYMYKAHEGSRHLLTFILVGILMLGMYENRKGIVLQVTFLAALSFFFVVKAGTPYDYLPPFDDGVVSGEVSTMQSGLEEKMELQKGIGWDNTIVWLASDMKDGESVIASWQQLYAVPGGFGINYCSYDYVYHNLGSMKSRYIAAIPGGDVEKMLVEEGALLLEANEKIAVYDRRPDETN